MHAELTIKIVFSAKLREYFEQPLLLMIVNIFMFLLKKIKNKKKCPAFAR